MFPTYAPIATEVAYAGPDPYMLMTHTGTPHSSTMSSLTSRHSKRGVLNVWAGNQVKPCTLQFAAAAGFPGKCQPNRLAAIFPNHAPTAN